MSSPLVALIALIASSPMATTTTMAFVVPTGTLPGSVLGAEHQKQERPMPRRLRMVVDDSMNTAAVAGGAESTSSRVGFLREQGEISTCCVSGQKTIVRCPQLRGEMRLRIGLGCYT